MKNILSKIFSFSTLIKLSSFIVLAITLCAILWYVTLDGRRNLNNNMVVEITGAVKFPGKKTVAMNATLKDLVDVAGGFTSDYDKDYVINKLNLAKKLKPDEKIEIPLKNQSSDTQTQKPSIITTSIKLTGTSIITQINLNKATPQELDTLPGVGPATVKKIIDNRPYKNIDELVSKKILSKTAYEKIKHQLIL